MAVFTSKISQFIENQFPSFYKDNGEIFVAFVTEYYKWLETSKNALYYSGNLKNIKDIDNTTDEFIVYFKETYLKNIQFDTSIDIRQLIKHSLDIYRSKGSPESINLIFKLVFGTDTEIYYPRDDIFKLSSGKWKIPRYLEISLNDKNVLFSNKQIYGVKSKASAFVEKVIRRKTNNKLIDVLYISSIKGNFITGEIITSPGNEVISNEKIKVTGSLVGIEINNTGTGTGYKVGQIIDIFSDKGQQAKGRVSNTTNFKGPISFDFLNGGYGYTSNLQTLISNNVFGLSNVISTNTNDYITHFSQLVQPMANVLYNTLLGNSSVITTGTDVYTYYANNLQKGHGKVIKSFQINTTSGYVKASILSGDLNSSKIFFGSNTTNATIQTYTDATSTANVISIDSNVDITIDTFSSLFSVGETVYQLDQNNNEISNGLIYFTTYNTGNNAILKLVNCNGVFLSNNQLLSKNTTTTSNTSSVDIKAYVKDVSNTFEIGYYVYSNNITSTINSISSGSGLSISVSNNIIDKEIIYLNSDMLTDFSNVSLSSSNYGFPTLTTSNSSSILSDVLSYNKYEIGKISHVEKIAGGENYSYSPYINFYEKIVADYKKQDLILNVSNNASWFQVGEFVTQESTGARGIIKENSTFDTLYIERLNFYDTLNYINLNTNSNTGISNNFISVGTNIFDDNDYVKYVTRAGNTAIVGLSNGATYYVVNSSVTGFKLSTVQGGSPISLTPSLISEEGHVFIKTTSCTFELTTNTNSAIIGQKSGTIGNITNILVDQNSNVMGLNANVSTSLQEGNGAILTIDIIDSGFGYVDKELLSFKNEHGVSYGYANVSTQGKSIGYYEKKGGTLSGNKKLPDGHYYQPYSYEIRSPITMDRYSAMLKSVVHAAGMKMYGAFVYSSNSQFNSNISSSVIKNSTFVDQIASIISFDNQLTGTRIAYGNASSSMQFNDTASGNRIAYGSISGTMQFNGAVTIPGIYGSISGTMQFNDTASGNRIAYGNASSSMQFNNLVNGTVIPGTPTYTITVGAGTVAEPIYYGFSDGAYTDAAFGGVSPSGSGIDFFAWYASGSVVAIKISGVSADTDVTWNSKVYTLTYNGDGTASYSDAGLGGPYPTSGTTTFTFTP